MTTLEAVVALALNVVAAVGIVVVVRWWRSFGKV